MEVILLVVQTKGLKHVGGIAINGVIGLDTLSAFISPNSYVTSKQHPDLNITSDTLYRLLINHAKIKPRKKLFVW